jgi:hypothetical protein
MAQTQVFRGTARAILNTQEGKHYVYHKTAVVSVLSDGSIRLNSGGWNTRTTLVAMNQASNQDGLGFKVYQRNFDWFVDFNNQTLPFSDNLILRG